MHYVLNTDNVSDLMLSCRLAKVLEKNNIRTIGDLYAAFQSGTWKYLAGTGTKLYGELKNWKALLTGSGSGFVVLGVEDSSTHTDSLTSLPLQPEQIKLLMDCGISRKSQLLNMSLSHLLSLPGITRETLPQMVHLLNEVKLSQDLHNPASALQCRIIEYIYRSPEGVMLHQLDQHFHTSCKPVLQDLLREKAICLIHNNYCRNRPDIHDFVDMLPESRSRDILIKRLDGMSFEDIGQELDLSRERIRQIVLKVLDGHISLKEDLLASLYGRYEISHQDLKDCLDVDDWTLRYLELTTSASKSCKSPLDDQFLLDESVPVFLRQKLSGLVHASEIQTGYGWIPKRKNAVIDYLAKHCCRQKTTMEEFLSVAQAFLEEHGLQTELALDRHTCENRLRDHPDVLWNVKHTFRWFDTSSRDFSELLTLLDLGQYKDVEMSTLKLYRENALLMHDYGLQDEYELHNLLRKIWNDDSIDVRFWRMPTITIGKPDRHQQIWNLMKGLSPIEAGQFAAEYEELYGVKAATVLGSYMADFYPFYHNGIYSVPSSGNDWFSEDQKTVMKARLDRDCFAMDEVMDIYHQTFPGQPDSRVNPHSLKSLGFRVYSAGNGYIVKDKWHNANDYFQSLLFKDDSLDVRTLPRAVRTNALFNTLLYDARSNGSLIEAAPGFNVTLAWLERKGITREDLAQFVQSWRDRIPDGQLFTISSLRADGKTFSLDGSGMDDWFYSSLLAADKDHFSATRYGRTRLLYKGQGKNLLRDLMKQMIVENGTMTLNEVSLVLECLYQIVTTKDKLLKTATMAELYYNSLDDRLYPDVKAYLGQTG